MRLQNLDKMEKSPILISGMQPTGRLHLGNYLGALKNFVALQNSGKYECYFFIADLHALTENPRPEDLRTNSILLTADYLAAGLDPKQSLIFLQSRIRDLPELKWFLGTFIPPGELMRMTAFKEKILQPLGPAARKKLTPEKFEKIVQSTNYGLVEYPVLMAADILIFAGELVPVGEDQLQHLELARTLARKFNRRFGKILKEPRALLTSTPRVMSLEDPTKKMSKSIPSGCLFIDDEPQIIRDKIKKAVTDSGMEIKYDKENKPAISNLLSIFSALSDESISELENKFSGKTYASFKEELAALVIDHFAGFRTKKSSLVKNPSQLKKILDSGSEKANAIAEKNMTIIKKKMGLVLL